MKNIILIILTLSLITVFHFCKKNQISIPTDGLIAWYPFDGNANDESENSLNGIIYGATLTTDQNGTPNSAFEFHGNDYIDLPNSPVIKPPLPFSFSLWVYFNDLDEFYGIFTTDYNVYDYTGAWMSASYNNDTVIGMGYGDGGKVGDPAARRAKFGTIKIKKEQWYYVVAVFRGPTDMDIYVNGIKDDGIYNGSGSDSIVYSDNPGSIGRRSFSVIKPPSAYNLHGKLSDILIYNRALFADEVMTIYEVQKPKIKSINNN